MWASQRKEISTNGLERSASKFRLAFSTYPVACSPHIEHLASAILRFQTSKPSALSPSPLMAFKSSAKNISGIRFDSLDVGFSQDALVLEIRHKRLDQR